MKLTIQIANPAGNITIFVRTPVPPDQYAPIASKLLALPEYQAEQVAFQTPTKMGALGRIEMMGGEFCGNATRSFGYLLSQEQPHHPDTVSVEISGANTPLLVTIDHQACTCQTQMPLFQKAVSIGLEEETFTAMVFDGIVHIIVPGAPRDQDFISQILETVKQALPCDAYGLMFIHDLDLVPLVYVVSTDSLIWEGSCGSGSMACACYFSLNKPDGCHVYRLSQPGGIIEASVTKKDRIFTECLMGGPITLSDPIHITL